MTKLTLSRLTSTNDLTKRFDLRNGQIIKTSAAKLTNGTIEKVEVEGLAGLANLIVALTPSQALAFGVLANGREKAQVVAKAQLEEARRTATDPNSIVARAREHLNFAHLPGIMMQDHDGFKDEVLSPEDLLERLTYACPSFGKASVLWKPSSSFGVHASHDSSIAIFGGGQRLYCAVQTAADIPEAGENLFLRLWAFGLGYIKISKSGQALKRSLLDGSLYQPEHLDFAGPVILGSGLVRTPWEPQIVQEGEFLEVADLRVNGDVETRARNAMRAAIEQTQPALREAREQWINTQAPELAQRRGISVNLARKCLLDASAHCRLSGDFLLVTEKNQTVSVGEVLDNPSEWHGTRFADPLEPDYGNNDHRIAWVNLRSGGRPYIYSHAHGGIRYALTRPAARIMVAVGQKGRILRDTEAVLGALGEIYDYGDGGTVKITASRIRPVIPDWLADYIDQHVKFFKVGTKPGGEYEERPCDAPDYLPKRILARNGDRDFRPLEGLVTAPILRRDGAVIDKPGYDDKSKLLYVSDSPNPPRVPVAPTPEDALRALDVLWQPFQDFPFVGEAAQTVMVSAIMSGILRQSLPTCPGYAFDAPVAGTGKTLLAECVGIIATGERPAIMAPTDDDNETRKRLFSILREGGGVILWDNISAPLGGDALDAFLTAESFRERVLGVSGSETVPNRALLLVTGNNIVTRGDTFRRVLKARLDAQLEAPYLRAFLLNPREYCIAHRHEMVVAALTIIRAWFQVGCPREAEGNTASFEDWDRLVRQPLAWLATIGLSVRREKAPRLCDVATVFAKAAGETPHKEKLLAVLQAWERVYGAGNPISARDLIPDNTGASDEKHEELFEAIVDAVGGTNRRVDATAIGYWLKKHADERINGLRFERVGQIRGSAAYVLMSRL